MLAVGMGGARGVYLPEPGGKQPWRDWWTPALISSTAIAISLDLFTIWTLVLAGIGYSCLTKVKLGTCMARRLWLVGDLCPRRSRHWRLVCVRAVGLHLCKVEGRSKRRADSRSPGRFLAQIGTASDYSSASAPLQMHKTGIYFGYVRFYSSAGFGG